MRKLLLMAVVAIPFLSCSEDTTVANENAALTTQVAAFEPQAQFNAKSQGVYVGSLVSTDLQHHAKIQVNVANNGRYTATTVINGERHTFEGVNNSKSFETIEFNNQSINASFTLNAADYQNPVVSNFTIDGSDGHMLLQKNDANNRADVLIGNYADVNDPNFFGAFDVFTSGTPHPYNGLASQVTRTSFVAPGGALFVDEVMETFDFTVCTEDANETDFIPLMFVNEAGSSAHFYADNQTSTVVDLELTWQIFHFLNDGYYIQFNNLPGFEDGCYETASGIWGWNGKYGVIAFDFFEAGQPGGVSPQEATAQALQKNLESDSVVLTSDIIEAVLAN